VVKFVDDIIRPRKLRNCYSNRVRSVSVIVVNGFELKPCRENLHKYFGSKVERIGYDLKVGDRNRTFSDRAKNKESSLPVDSAG
jgi:hypothetical protein